MKTELARLARFAAMGLLVLSAAGCSKKVDSIFRDNLPPEVRLTSAPISTQGQYFYSYRMNWVGFDPDGRIDHYLVAIDPARPDSVGNWTETTKNEEVFTFRSTQPDSSSLFVNATDFHVFAIAAVDNNGAVSKPVWRAFFSFTQAPQVQIDEPTPNGAFTPIVTPTVRIRWHGTDPDGQLHTKPIKYKFKLFGKINKDFPSIADYVTYAISNPSVIRNTYAPVFGPSLLPDGTPDPNGKCPTCSYWDSLPADTTEFQYTNLTPSQIYLFVVTGFDEAGAYDPVFSPSSNMLKFAVTYAGSFGPVICMFNEFFNFCYETGGYSTDPTRYFNVEVPADTRVNFFWIATPPPGADIRFYRWVLDLEDLTDETPRTSELSDWYHWSSRSLQTISATIGPFGTDPPDHLFFIEAEDNNGLRSLGIIHFTVVRATFENEILFVDDTRLAPDNVDPSGNFRPPSGTWPTAAELDTFFFARGGFPWRGGYPAGTLSPPGIFKGYPIKLDGLLPDTMGTRGLPTGIVSLARLGRYKRVVWYTDETGATYTGSPVELLAPITSLRLMSGPGQPSTISTYMKQGGKVWMFGGGAAYASLVVWQKKNTPPDDWTNDQELIPGRFMYDFPHWQSSVAIRPARQALLNSIDFAPWENAAPGRGYTNHGINHDVNMPDYNKLENNPYVSMQVLNPRSCLTDPPSPLRVCNSFYLLANYQAEYIGRVPPFGSIPNFIREDADSTINGVREESTLDTLYLASGGSMPSPLPVMTYYHGFQSPQCVFSGFALWFFRRAQVIQLSDFVLQDIMGLPAPPAGSRGTGAGLPQPARIAGAPSATTVSTIRAAATPQRR
jgi:hypothetical protein